MAMKTFHISSFDLERHSRGMLQKADVERIEQHLVGCPVCCQRMESIGRYVRALPVRSVQYSQEFRPVRSADVPVKPVGVRKLLRRAFRLLVRVLSGVATG